MKYPLGLTIWVVIANFAAIGPVFALSSAEAARQLEAIKWYSEEYPPYNFSSKNGVATGICVDILLAALKRVGAKVTAKDIKIIPWNRSYKFIQRKPGTALFAMTYSPERRKIMKFVGPAASSDVAIIAPASKARKFNFKSILASQRIGVVRDDIGDQLLRKLAISNEVIVRKNSLKQLLYLLKTGKIDAVSYAVSVFKYAVKRAGGRPESFKSVYTLKNGAVGFAFHKSTDDAVLGVLQKAIDDLRKAGTIDQIIKIYQN